MIVWMRYAHSASGKMLPGSEHSGSVTGNPAKLMLFLMAALLVAAIFAMLSTLVKLLIISALLAYVLSPLARLLESLGISRNAATTIVFTAIFLATGITIVVFFPVLGSEIAALRDKIASEETSRMLESLESRLSVNLSFLGFGKLNLPGKVQEALVGAGSWLFNHFLDAASAMTSMIVIPFIVFFFLRDGRAFKRTLVSLVPNRYFEFTLYMLYKLNIQFGNYLRGQLLDSFVVGFLTTVVLWANGFNYFLVIGAFTGLANIVPYFGPIAGASLAVVISLLQTGNPGKILFIIIAFASIKLIDDMLVQPLIVARTVKMHPLTVLLAVLAGGHLYGVLGMLIAVPVIGFIKAVAKETITNYRKYGEA
jgi:putative permease